MAVPAVMASGWEGEDSDGGYGDLSLIFDCKDDDEREECRCSRKNKPKNCPKPIALIKGDFKAYILALKESDSKNGPSHGGNKFDLTCAQACFLTPSCRNDPNAHGAYCKYGQHPPVCFGLYHLPKRGRHGDGWGKKGSDYKWGSEDGEDDYGWDGDNEYQYGSKDGFSHLKHRFCFQPSQPWCPQQKPVLCGRPHPYHNGWEQTGH
jgi:hypothetical protein